ncbi:hypothetical protein GCM10027034_19060 [Ramlibacter solisilvae]|uniref:Uncharacterized protein n=1 Tax=Ramlibacter tataouinensis TaxID=94132 RepID=A0A127JVG5_9BURK|nr:hypothetical protein [Ramlibacter tataouinensis]AMO23987.1 hypothetical protein UC35_15365 [Ramlibacter tataouinensis]
MTAVEKFLEEQRAKQRAERVKTALLFGFVVLGLIFFWFRLRPESDEARNVRIANERISSCRISIDTGRAWYVPEVKAAVAVLDSKTASLAAKETAVDSVCEGKFVSLKTEFDRRPQSNEPPRKSYEESVREAWEKADADNRKIDEAQEAMITDYRRRARSSSTSATAAGRADSFVMQDGSIVICTTTFRHGARATTCN